MLAVPARIAGCPQRVLCTPPQRDGGASPRCWSPRSCAASITYSRSAAPRRSPPWPTARRRVPKVDKIFGPGNAWVTAAKQLVAADPDGAALDMPAGPSEVLVIADDSARAEFVAADLLAQAEHDPQSQAMLVTTSAELARAGARPQCARRCAAVAPDDPAPVDRRTRASSSCRTSTSAIAVSERYAPEHLIIQTRAAARAARADPQRRLDFPRRLVARADGRLLLRHQSRAADLRLCARLQRSVGAGFHAPHDRAGAHRRRAARRSVPPRAAGAPGGTGRARRGGRSAPGRAAARACRGASALAEVPR